MPPEPLPALRDIVGAIAFDLHPDRIGTGALATLRRLDPLGALAEPALQRLLWRHVPEDRLGITGLRRWALVTHALALGAPDLHRGQAAEAQLGGALFAARFSEGRLTRFLESQPSDLAVAVPRMVRFLVAKGQAFNAVALAHWVMDIGSGGNRAEQQRTRVAADYYRAERAVDKTA